MYRLYLINIFILLFFCSCNKNREIERLVKQWQNREIIFPHNIEAKIFGKDTLCTDLFDYQFKLLVYIDTVGCTPCQLRLYDWFLFIQECKEMSDNMSFLFFVYSKDYAKIDEQQIMNKFSYPIIYDYHGTLDSLNQFPKNRIFQTFLLDKDNKVILIGNPIDNPIVGDLIQKTIKEKT